MKQLIFSVLAISIITGGSCHHGNLDNEKEMEAIKHVVQAQLDAYTALSYKAEAATWAHRPYIVRRDIVGWDSLSEYYKETFKERKEDTENIIKAITAYNFDIYVNGNFASVFHDERYETTRNGQENAWDRSMHKYLEKIDGAWKVIAMF